MNNFLTTPLFIIGKSFNRSAEEKIWSIFAANLELVGQHNKRAANGSFTSSFTYKLGLNQYSDFVSAKIY